MRDGNRKNDLSCVCGQKAIKVCQSKGGLNGIGELTTFYSQLGVNMQKAIRKGLLPCPHCGGRAGLWQAYDSSWCVQCDRCGASTMRFDKDEVIKRWNRRVGNDNQRTKFT